MSKETDLLPLNIYIHYAKLKTYNKKYQSKHDALSLFLK